ncbi:MAG: hypothetical protein ACLGXA_16575 [Acidobacteriota bacterium]
MVIAIDGVRYEEKLNAASAWRTGIADYIPEEERQTEAVIVAPARGILYGLLVSGAMWVGLVAAARALLALVQ